MPALKPEVKSFLRNVAKVVLVGLLAFCAWALSILSQTSVAIKHNQEVIQARLQRLETSPTLSPTATLTPIVPFKVLQKVGSVSAK